MQRVKTDARTLEEAMQRRKRECAETAKNLAEEADRLLINKSENEDSHKGVQALCAQKKGLLLAGMSAETLAASENAVQKHHHSGAKKLHRRNHHHKKHGKNAGTHHASAAIAKAEQTLAARLCTRQEQDAGKPCEKADLSGAKMQEDSGGI